MKAKARVKILDKGTLKVIVIWDTKNKNLERSLVHIEAFSILDPPSWVELSFDQLQLSESQQHQQHNEVLWLAFHFHPFDL